MDSKDIDFIKSVINKYIDPRENKVFIFGSRATNKVRRYSDYDIGIVGEKLSARKYFDIESEFEESDFPYTVDIVEFRDVSDRFKEIAKKSIIKINY